MFFFYGLFSNRFLCFFGSGFARLFHGRFYGFSFFNCRGRCFNNFGCGLRISSDRMLSGQRSFACSSLTARQFFREGFRLKLLQLPVI